MVSLLPVLCSKIGASSSSAFVSATEVTTLTSAPFATIVDSISPARAAAACIVSDRPFMNISRPVLIDRKIGLVRDLGPARGLPTHHVSELLWRHGFGFGTLICEKRGEFGRGQHLVDLRVERLDDICRHPGRSRDAPPRLEVGARC